MTEWIELFKVEKIDKSGLKSTTTISINKKHEDNWIETLKEWIKKMMEI